MVTNFRLWECKWRTLFKLDVSVEERMRQMPPFKGQLSGWRTDVGEKTFGHVRWFFTLWHLNSTATLRTVFPVFKQAKYANKCLAMYCISMHGELTTHLWGLLTHSFNKQVEPSLARSFCLFLKLALFCARTYVTGSLRTLSWKASISLCKFLLMLDNEETKIEV